MGDILQSDDDDGKNHPVSSFNSENYYGGILTLITGRERISHGTVLYLASESSPAISLNISGYVTGMFQAHQKGGLVLS